MRGLAKEHRLGREKDLLQLELCWLDHIGIEKSTILIAVSSSGRNAAVAQSIRLFNPTMACVVRSHG